LAEIGLEDLGVMWDDHGANGQAMVAANGALEGASLIGSASAVLEEVVGAESSMTELMTSLGAGLQGVRPGIAPVVSVGAGQTSVDASGLWDADTAYQEVRVRTGEMAARCDSQPIVRQEAPAAERAYSGTSNDFDLVPLLPEIWPPKVGWGPLPEATKVQPRARNDSPAVLSLRSVANAPNDPAKLITAAIEGENHLMDASLENSTLGISDIGSRARSLISVLSRNFNVTRTEPGTESRPVSGDAIELTQQRVSSISGEIEAAPPTARAPLQKNTPAAGAWQKSPDQKAARPDGRLDGLEHQPISGPSSEPQHGVVVVDGGYLGRWIFDCLSRQASRPSGGTTGIDPRVSATYPGAAVGV
jgi:hypothetical protein